MTSSTESAIPNEGTDVFRRFLVDAVQDISTSVSFLRFEQILDPLTTPREELYNYAQDYIAESMESIITRLMENNISQKLEDLKDLEKDHLFGCQKEQSCRRPKADHIDTSGLEAQALQDRKAKLLERIAVISNHNEELRKIIVEERQELKKQKDKMQGISRKMI